MDSGVGGQAANHIGGGTSLTPSEASDYLRNKFGIRRAVKTLAKLRCVSSEGPVFVRVGRDILYPQDGLDLYGQNLISAPMRSTSDKAGRPDPAEHQPIAA